MRDGGSRGNPGLAAVAAVLVARSGEVIDRDARLIGDATAAEVRVAAGGFSAVRWTWHHRGQNEAADALVRE